MFWHRVAREFFDVGFEHWAVYVGRVGVADDGTPVGLGCWEMGASLKTLRTIGRENGAALDPVVVVEVAPGLYVAEVVLEVGGASDDPALEGWTSRRDADETAAASAEAERARRKLRESGDRSERRALKWEATRDVFVKEAGLVIETDEGTDEEAA